jgi:mannose-6-phosphate isomerase class I
VWGGSRLKPPESPIAEMWAVYENDRIAEGPLAGRKLEDIAAEHGEALLGTKPAQMTGKRFPLLIKLLDCARWLSIQVHPNDEQAARLEGPDQFGKTEAWYIIEADPGAELLAGMKPGLDQQKLDEVTHGGDKIMDWLKHYHVIDVQARSEPQQLPEPPHGRDQMIASQYFQLEHLQVDGKSLDLDTKGESFHALTAIAGSAILEGENWLMPAEEIWACGGLGAAGTGRTRWYYAFPQQKNPYRILISHFAWMSFAGFEIPDLPSPQFQSGHTSLKNRISKFVKRDRDSEPRSTVRALGNFV